MQNTFLTTAAMAFGALLGGTASAAHIDFFNEGNAMPLFLVGGSSATDTYTDPDPGTPAILGDTRISTLTYAPGPSTGLIVSSVTSTSGGQLAFSNGSETRGTLILDYFGTATDGVSFDLVTPDAGLPYDAFRIDVASLDGPFSVDVTVVDGGGTTTSAGTSFASAGPVFLPYAFFGAVDFTDVEQLTFSFIGAGLGADLALDGIFRATVVPEPASAVAAGLVGLVVLRRRR